MSLSCVIVSTRTHLSKISLQFRDCDACFVQISGNTSEVGKKIADCFHLSGFDCSVVGKPISSFPSEEEKNMPKPLVLTTSFLANEGVKLSLSRLRWRRHRFESHEKKRGGGELGEKAFRR